MIKQVIEINREEWQTLLAHSSTASYFQSPECYDFYCSLSFLEPFGWGVWEGKELKALVIGYIIANGGKLKQFFSRRAIIHGGMLLANNVSEDAISELLGELKHSLSKQVIYIEIRNANSYINHKAIFAKHGFEYNAHHNYIVKTDTIEQVISRYSESKVRQLRNIQERGVVCVQTTCKNDIDRFYQILEDLYRKKIKKPLYPKEFFDKFVHQSGCYLFVVKNDEKIIGGIACSSLTGKAVYEWFICGDTKNFDHLYPSVLATHTGIEYAVKNGFEYFDFMGAERYGVRKFKSKFGGELVEHGRFKYIVNPLLYAIGTIYIKLLTQEK